MYKKKSQIKMLVIYTICLILWFSPAFVLGAYSLFVENIIVSYPHGDVPVEHLVIILSFVLIWSAFYIKVCGDRIIKLLMKVFNITDDEVFNILNTISNIEFKKGW